MTAVNTAINTDMLGKSGLLRKSTLVKREDFDPTNIDHLKSLRCYVETGNWGDVQFYIELPYTTVPETVMRKMVSHTLAQMGV